MSSITQEFQQNRVGYWAFLANPRVYRIEDAVRELDVDTWTTKRSDVAKGDRVLIWKAKGADPVRGIIALGEVLTDPVPMSDESDYWIDPAAARTVEDRVRIRYLRPPELPLWLGGPFDAVLRDLNVSRATGGTVFHVTPAQWIAVLDAAGGWPEEAPEVADVRALVEELAGGRVRGQGFQVSTEVRRAVEKHAMTMAQAHFEAQGWQVEDVSATRSYDLHCTRPAGEELRVEVKGTTGDGTEVLLTPNEVLHARALHPHVALFLVSGIQLAEVGVSVPVTRNGTVHTWIPWEIEKGTLAPIGYSYTLPPQDDWQR